MHDLRRAGSQLEIPDPAVDRACTLFKSYHDEQPHTGWSIDAMAAGALYVAIRCFEVGVTATAVAEQFGLGEETSRRPKDYVYDEAERLQTTLGLAVPVRLPSTYVDRYVNALDGSSRTVTIATRIAAEVDETRLATSGNNPQTVAAAIVYEAFLKAGNKQRQTTVADTADVSPKRLREHWKTITDIDLDADIDDLTP
jgi:transcription initiation factor TFIIIB Brf1 subunit/transcription initiation factor TFIIB